MSMLLLLLSAPVAMPLAVLVLALVVGLAVLRPWRRPEGRSKATPSPLTTRSDALSRLSSTQISPS